MLMCDTEHEQCVFRIITLKSDDPADNTMPICCVINKDYLCMHGGISPAITLLADIEKIDRF